MVALGHPWPTRHRCIHAQWSLSAIHGLHDTGAFTCPVLAPELYDNIPPARVLKAIMELIEKCDLIGIKLLAELNHHGEFLAFNLNFHGEIKKLHVAHRQFT